MFSKSLSISKGICRFLLIYTSCSEGRTSSHCLESTIHNHIINLTRFASDFNHFFRFPVLFPNLWKQKSCKNSILQVLRAVSLVLDRKNSLAAVLSCISSLIAAGIPVILITAVGSAVIRTFGISGCTVCTFILS